MRPLKALMIVCLACTTAFAGIQVGEVFPDLKNFRLEGNLPEKLTNKVVLVDFWASWCGPCKQSFPAMSRLQKRFAKDGLVVIAISVDEQKADMEAFLKKSAVEFSVLRDAGHAFVNKADIAALPTSFLIDRTGKVRFVHTGFAGERTAKEYETEIQSLLGKSTNER